MDTTAHDRQQNQEESQDINGCSRRGFLKNAGVVGASALTLAGTVAAPGLAGCTNNNQADTGSTGSSATGTGSSGFSPVYESGVDTLKATAANEAASEPVYSSDNKGYSFEQDGWQFLHIEGAPRIRGVQYGELFGVLIEETIARQKSYFVEVAGYDWDYFKTGAQTMWESSIGQEWIDELSGIVEGAQSKGGTFDLWDLIVWNAYSELTDYWFPKVADDYYKGEPAGVVQAGTPAAWEHKNHCSAFIATGSYTHDGGIVMGHSTWQTYEIGRYANIIIDIVPESGQHILMQSKPGYIHSQADYYQTDSLLISETTIGSFKAYAQTGIPEFVRIRQAAQYATDLDSFVTTLNEGNTGGYANTWLVGDVATGEIMRFEQGLKFYNADKTTDGYYAGFNAALDPRIRTHETKDSTLFANIKEPSGSRFIRIPQLLEQYKGELDLEIAKTILADHYDPYLGVEDHPGVRSICSHYDRDPMDYGARLPYRPQGSVDGKVGSTETALAFSLHARFGKSCGMPFELDAFLEEHPQFEYLREFLVDFPALPWTELKPQ